MRAMDRMLKAGCVDKLPRGGGAGGVNMKLGGSG